MNLLTQIKFAELAGVSSPAITKARKNNRVEYYQGTKEYDIDSPLNKSFLSTIPKERLNKLVVTEVTKPGEKSEKLENASEMVLLATEKKIIEEAEFKEQQKIEKQLKNAYTLGEHVKIESIETTIMTWFDSWLNTNKRRFNGSFDEFIRMAFMLFENEQGSKDPDFKPHDLSRSEIKRKWVNDFEKWQHEGNKEATKRLLEIQKEQSEG